MREFKKFYLMPVIDEQKGSWKVKWLIDPQLQRNIGRMRQDIPTLDEALLARQLFAQFNANPQRKIIKEHWSAFLLSFSWTVAIELKQEIPKTRLNHCDPNAFFKDLLQLAMNHAFHPQKFLEKFDSSRASTSLWYPTLKVYTREKMQGLLVDEVRRMEGFKTFKRSNWGLAARASKKRVADALKWMGQRSALLDQYLLVWQCFQEAYQAKLINISSPQPKQLSALAQQYNQRRDRLSLPVNSNPALSGEEISRYLEEIGAAIRHYIDQPITSLVSDENDFSWLDYLADPSSTLNLEVLELGEQKQLLYQFITDQIRELSLPSQQLLFLRYGLELKQVMIAKLLEIEQAKVSRCCTKLLKFLLDRLMQEKWILRDQQLNLTSETLQLLKADLQELLHNYYQDWLVEQLRKALAQQSNKQKECLRLAYRSQPKRDRSSVPIQGIEDQLKKLLYFLNNAIQKEFQFPLSLTNQKEIKFSLASNLEQILAIALYLEINEV